MHTVKPLPEFSDWLAGLKDLVTRTRLIRRLEKVARGLLGDGELVGEYVGEMRERLRAWLAHVLHRA